MLLWLLGLASAALVFFCVKVWKAQRYWKEKGIPYDKPIPFFGIMHDVLTRRKSFIECLDEIYRAHPDARYVKEKLTCKNAANFSEQIRGLLSVHEAGASTKRS